MGYKDYDAMSKANWDRVIEEIEGKIKRHIEKEYQKTLSYNDRKEKENKRNGQVFHCNSRRNPKP